MDVHGSRKREASMKPEPNPKQKAGFLSLLSFWWMEGIMRKGNQTTLTDHDLPSITDAERSKELVEKLEHDWREEVGRWHRKGPKPQLWKSLLRLISWKEWACVLTLRLTQSAVYVSQSVILWFFLQSLANTSQINYKSISIWVLAIFATTTWIALGTTQWIFRVDVWGIRWKIATIGLIYKKVSFAMGIYNSYLISDSPR